MSTLTSIPGYTYGTEQVPRSPIGMQEFDLLKQTAMFGEEDVRYLRMSKDVLLDQIEAVLDAWYGFFASHPFLLRYFEREPDHQPDENYMAAVRKRFGQWILDTADANYDQKWLDYQYEIGLRHSRSEKNKTDHVNSVEEINFRYMIPSIYPIVHLLRPYFANKGHSFEEVEKMQQAWLKSILLQVALWSQAYVKEGDF